MDVWQLVLYAVASFLALRSLISLMAHHRRHFHHQMMAEEHQKAVREKKVVSERADSKETTEAAA
jgi:predicted tellurium resistance membrane protein TerC